MNLVLIGGKSSKVIKDIIIQNFDNLSINVYKSMGEFVEITNIRTVSVDRIILLQDALTNADDIETKLLAFNDYICKWFPVARFISIVKEQSMLEMISGIFLSPLMVHICTTGMKPSMLNDLVGQPIEVVKKKYGSAVALGSSSGIVGEIIGGVVDSISEESAKPPQPEQKKKGLFGAFKKNKELKKKNGATSTVEQQLPSVVAPVVEEDTLQQETNLNDYDPRTVEDFEEQDDADWNFSVFNMDGESDIGVDVANNNLLDMPIFDSTESIKPVNKPIIQQVEVKDIDDEALLFDDIDTLTEEYDNKNVKVVEIEKLVEIEKVVEVEVERVVEVEKVVERVVNIGSTKRNYRNGVRTVIVTGDRKVGVTKTALNMCKHYAKIESTLYVDFDLDRKGSLLYFGLENLIEEEEHVHNGLNYLNNIGVLKNIVYTFPKGGFDCLVSMYGTDFENSKIQSIQQLLASQREYKTLVIDCPMDKLHHLEDLLFYAEVFICTETNLPNVLNTVLGLISTTDNEKLLSLLFNSGHYFITSDGELQEFKENMRYVIDTFSLEDETINWGSIPVIGSLRNFREVLEGF